MTPRMRLPAQANSYQELVQGFAWEIPASFNIADELCDRHARNRPDDVAIIEDNTGIPARVYTYAELHEWSADIAGGLRARGVAPGCRVAVCLPQGAEALAVHLAVFRLGAILVPIAAVFSGESLRYRLADSGAMLMVCTAAGANQLRQAGRPECVATVVSTNPTEAADLCMVDMVRSSSPMRTCVLTPSDAAAIIFYTSGTTGPAKGAVMAARLLFALLPGFQTVYDLAPQAGDVFWTPSDWAWLGALELVYPAFYFGHPVVASAARFKLEETYRILSQHSVTCAFLAPTVLRRMRGAPPPIDMPFRLRTISTGVKRWRWRCKHGHSGSSAPRSTTTSDSLKPTTWPKVANACTTPHQARWACPWWAARSPSSILLAAQCHQAPSVRW